MPDVFRFPVTNTQTQRPTQPASLGPQKTPPRTLDYLQAAAVTNNATIADSQATQAAVASLVQHQHLTAVGAQPAQAATASAAQHDHLAGAGSQPAQQSAAVSSSHQHLALSGSQAVQASSVAAAQHQHAAVVTTQPAQTVDADLHSHVHLVVETSQAAQSATAEAAQHQHMGAETGQAAQASVVSSDQHQDVSLTATQAPQESAIASGDVVTPPVANNAALETEQSPQTSEIAAAADPFAMAGRFHQIRARREVAPLRVAPKPPVVDWPPDLVGVNGAVMVTAQPAQTAHADVEMDHNNLVLLYDLIDDDELAFAMLGVAL